MSSGIVIDSYVVGFLTALVVAFVLLAVARVFVVRAGDQTGFTADIKQLDTNEFLGSVDIQLEFVPDFIVIDGKEWVVSHSIWDNGQVTLVVAEVK